MKLKIGKKFTARLNSKFTGSYEKYIVLAFGMGGFWVGFISAVNTKLVIGFVFGIDYCIVYDTLKHPHKLNFAKLYFG